MPTLDFCARPEMTEEALLHRIRADLAGHCILVAGRAAAADRADDLAALDERNTAGRCGRRRRGQCGNISAGGVCITLFAG